MGSHLVIKLVLPMLIACIIVIVILSQEATVKGPEWIAPVRADMVIEDEQALQVQAYQQAQTIGHMFKQGQNSLLLMETYISDLINGNLAKTLTTGYQAYYSPRGSTGTYPQGTEYRSDNAVTYSCMSNEVAAMATMQYANTATYDAINYAADLTGRVTQDWIDHEAKWWQPPNYGGTMTTAELEAEVKDLSIIGSDSMVNVFNANLQMQMVYLGVATSHIMLEVPFVKDSNSRCSYKGVDADTDAVFYQYDPTRRPWYKAAKDATDCTVPIYNPVDTDASTGLPYIGISKAVYKGGSSTVRTCAGALWGVIAIDVSIKIMKESLDKVKLRGDGTSWSAYGYVVGADGNVGLHKTPLPLGDAVMSVEVAEFGTASSTEKTTFINEIKPMLMNQTETRTVLKKYTKNGAEWIMAFSPIKPGGYMAVLTVLTKDLEKPADELETQVLAAVDVAVILATLWAVMMVCLLLAFTAILDIILAHPIYTQSQRIKVSSSEEDEYCTNIVAYEHGTNPDRLYDWPSQEWNSDPNCARDEPPFCLELEQITNNLEEMQVAMRFSNHKYLTQNPAHPQKIFRQAMEVTTKYDNERGKGVCFSAIGNTLPKDEYYMPPDTRDSGGGSAVAQKTELTAEECLMECIRIAHKQYKMKVQEFGGVQDQLFSERKNVGVDYIGHRDDGANDYRDSTQGVTGVELGILDAKERVEEKRNPIDDAYKALATRELSLGILLVKNQQFDDAISTLRSSEKRLTEMIFGHYTAADIREKLGSPHNPALLDGLTMSGKSLDSHSPSGIVAAYGKAMWFQIKAACLKRESMLVVGDLAEMPDFERKNYYNNIREAGLSAAKQLQRAMQLHLEPTRIVDGDLAYSWAAIATTFIEADPRYSLNAMCEINYCERTTLRILVDTSVWFSLNPNTALDVENKDAGYFDADQISMSVEGVLGGGDALPGPLRQAMGDPGGWKYKRSQGPPGKPWPLVVDKVNPPWTGGGHASGPSIKAVCFILDVSGSMAGTRMTRTKANLLMVYDKYIGAADDVCYIEFNTKVTIKAPLARKSPAHRAAMDAARASGGTNFYDAMLAGIDQLEQAGSNRKKYVIALTDGANGRSHAAPQDVVTRLRNNPEITPFIIGAGGDIPQFDVGVMQRMTGEQPLVPSIGGMYVAAKNTDDLEAAFESVAASMNDAEMESL